MQKPHKNENQENKKPISQNKCPNKAITKQ